MEAEVAQIGGPSVVRRLQTTVLYALLRVNPGMLDLRTAQKLVEKEINSSYTLDGDELVVLEEETIEKEYGWIFFYTSRRFLETGNVNYMLAGNAPIVVDKRTGKLTWLGTAEPFENYLRPYDESLPADGE